MRVILEFIVQIIEDVREGFNRHKKPTPVQAFLKNGWYKGQVSKVNIKKHKR